MVKPFSEFNFLNKLIIIFSFSESKFPVGSSANNIFGLFIKDLATATLCLSPPDIESGCLRSILLIPNKLANS